MVVVMVVATMAMVIGQPRTIIIGYVSVIYFCSTVKLFLNLEISFSPDYKTKDCVFIPVTYLITTTYVIVTGPMKRALNAAIAKICVWCLPRGFSTNLISLKLHSSSTAL